MVKFYNKGDLIDEYYVPESPGSCEWILNFFFFFFTLCNCPVRGSSMVNIVIYKYKLGSRSPRIPKGKELKKDGL